MRRFAAVALREIAERRFVLVAAAVAAVLPFLVPLLPGVPTDQGPMARSIAALTLSCAFGLGGSLLVGASVVGRELAERRLSFHYSRPLSGPVIWGGKLVGGLALVLLAEAIVFLPSSAASGRFPGLWGGTGDTWVIWAVQLLAVPLFLLAWVGSVALRSRSPWLVVDLVLLVGVPALLFVIGRRLVRYGHLPRPSWALAAAGVLLAALLGATLAQVFAGRTDGRRGHGAQSLTLWITLLLATAAGAAWAERVIDPGVTRFVRAWAFPAGEGGDWVFVEGSAQESGEGRTRYLVNLSTRRTRLLPVTSGAVVSADGSRAAYVTGSPFASREITVETIDLKTSEAASLDLSEAPTGIALSADGRRLAVVSQGICNVLELPSLRSLAAARAPSARWACEPRFVSPDVVRLYPRRNRRAAEGSTEASRVIEDPVAAELHVGTKTVTTLATYPITSIPFPSRKVPGTDPGPVFHLLPSPDLSRILVLGFGSAHGLRLLDAASGRVLASVDGSEEMGNPIGLFLADGRTVVSEPIAAGRRLAILAPDGTRQGEIALPAGTKYVRIGHEVARGLLAVSLTRDGQAETWDSYLADLASGGVRPLAVQALDRPFWTDSVFVPAPGSPATRLAWDKGSGRLVLFEPATGATKPLTRGKAAGK